MIRAQGLVYATAALMTGCEPRERERERRHCERSDSAQNRAHTLDREIDFRALVARYVDEPASAAALIAEHP